MKFPEKWVIHKHSGETTKVYEIPFRSFTLRVIASNFSGWDHVSVSLKNRCPNWEEMCYIKNLFWDEEDMVVQYHPKKSDYVNLHNYCLHMWKPQNFDIPMPEPI